MNTPDTEKCEFITDHDVLWAGDGYYCHKCMTEFVPRQEAILEGRRQTCDYIEKVTSSNCIRTGHDTCFSNILDEARTLPVTEK